MQINLSDEARVWAEQQVVHAGFKSINDYLEALVRRDREEAAGGLDELIDVQCPPGVNDDVERGQMRQVLQDRVVALLDEAVDSGPATPMTAQDWQDIRRKVQERRQREGQ